MLGYIGARKMRKKLLKSDIVELCREKGVDIHKGDTIANMIRKIQIGEGSTHCHEPRKKRYNCQEIKCTWYNNCKNAEKGLQ